MAKRQKLDKHGFANVLLSVVYHIVPLLLAEECGILRVLCKQLSQCGTLARQFPTHQSFLSVVADYQSWPERVRALQGGLCEFRHIHISGMIEDIVDKPILVFFDILYDENENETQFFTCSGLSMINGPKMRDIMTKPLHYIRENMIKELLRMHNNSQMSINFRRCGLDKKHIVVTCATRGKPCSNSKHDETCFSTLWK